MDTTARTKIYRKLNRRQKILRQHTASADKKEYLDGTIFRYYFMKLIYEITVFPLIITLGLYLISKILGEVLIRGQRLGETGAYFKVREIHHVKFQNFVFVLFNNKNETQNLKTKKKKKKIKTSKYQQ